MKQNESKRILSLVLALVMVIGLIPAAAIPVFAQNITGLIYASGIRANEGVVLMGDTTLNMDTDLTVPSIEGDYNLTVQGSGKLTVNGSGNGIDVKSLKCYSDVFIQTGWHAIEVTETVYIDNAESFIVGGIYAAGHIDIRCNNATIAGNDYAISSALGSVTLSGDTFDIGANGVAVYAKTGGIYMTGNFTVNSNNGRTIDTAKGEVVINGSLKSTSGAKFDPEVSFINRDRISIGAMNGFFFYGTTLEVEGLGGIVAGNYNLDTDISITADSVSIITERYEALNGGNIYVDSDELWLENEGSEENEDAIYDSATIYADKDVTLSSESGGIVGEIALTVFGTLTLNGNFVVGGDSDHDNPLIIANRMEANGKLVLRNDTGLAVDASESFSFNGTTLDVEGYAGIAADNIDVTADSVVITTDVGDALNGVEVYVTANDLWAENKATKVNSDWSGQHGISAESKLSLTVKGGTVIGYVDGLHVYDEANAHEHHYVYVDGSLTVVSKTGAGIYVPQGAANLYGGSIVSVGETHGVHADVLTFEGDSLRIDGNTGVYAISGVEMDGDDIRITAFNERRSGIWVENGYVDLKGKVVIETNGWYGINADTHVAFEEGYYQIIGPKNDAQAVKAGGFLYLDGTLEIIQPDGGHVNGNNIYGAGDSPAMEVTIFSALDEVSLYITAPSEGNRPTWDASGIYYLDPRCTVEKIVWYENGEEMSGDAVFKAGKSYSVQLILSADGDYYFVDDMVGKINGNPVFTGISANKLMLLEADMGTCASTIGIVGLTIDAPEQYSSPDQSVVCADSAYKQALAGDNMFDAPVQWQKSTDGKNWTTMNLNETFTLGNYYRVYIDIMPAAGYEFALDPQLDPNVIATVNGYPAVVSRYPEADPSTLISVCYDFGQLNDTVIEQIDIDGVVEPVVGEKPSYNCAISGSGYTVNTAYDNGTYAINGICWYDVTDDMWVRPNHTFQIGHQYKVFVDVKTESGYEFYTTHVGSSYKPAGWGYINSNYATLGNQSDARFEQSLSWTFTCQPKTVKAVAVMDLEVPADGFAPDFDAVTDSDYYTVESIVWTDYTTGTDMTENDTFVAGNEYWVMITVVPKEEEGNKLCKFVSDKTVATLNGIEVKDLPDDAWQEVTSSTKRVVIFYTFKKASSAGDNNFLTGTVTSFNDAAGEITLQLIPQGLPEVAYETTVRGNTVDYYFAGVAAGTYTLKVSKANHVTRTYTVTVGNGSVVQDVKIHLKGDIDGNGKINVGDTTKVYSHVKKTALITDEYMLLCADVSGDGRINVGDTTKVYAHVKKTSLLW